MSTIELAMDDPPPPKARPAPVPVRPPPHARPGPVAAAVAKPVPPPVPPPAPPSIDADIDIDLSRGNPAALPARLQGAQNTGLRIGPGGELVASRLPSSRLPSAGRAGLDEDGHDPYEIRAYADFGDVPEAFYLTPLYALRVHKRMKELHAELEQRMATVRAASDQVENAVIAFGERVRPMAAANPIYVRTVAPIEDAERLVGARDAGLASEMEAYKKTTAAVDQRLSALEADLHRLTQESAALEAELATLEEKKKRAEAKIKRVDIELRTAEPAMASDGTSSASRTAEKTQEREALLAAIAQLLPSIAMQTKKLEVPRAARAAIERQISEVRRERVTAQDRLKRQTGTREAGVEDARKKVRVAMSEFARTALADAKTFGGEFDASREAIEQLVRDKDELGRAVLMLEKAIATADMAAVKRGWMVAIGAVLAVLLLIFSFPIYRVFVPVQAPPLYE